MTSIIRTERLTKAYGEHRGIIDVDLEVAENEIFGFLGPNGAGKTTTIRTLLDLIRPTSGRAFVFDIETTVDPVADPPPDRLHPGRVRAVRPPDRRPDDPVLRQPPRRRRPRRTRRPSSSGWTSTRAASSRSCPRATSRRSAWSSRSSTGRSCWSSTSRRPASTRSSSRRSTSSSARPAPRAGPCSCPATSCPRSSAPATASRSSATAQLVKVDSIEALRDLAHHQVELRFAGHRAGRRVHGAAGRVRRERRGPHAPAARLRPDHAGGPGRGPLRAARLRQP